MSIDYTRKQTQAIRDAFRDLEYVASCADMRARFELREALKHERRERSSILVAKALLVECFLEGLEDPAMNALAVDGVSKGCQAMLLFGVRIAHRGWPTSAEGMMAKALERMRAVVLANKQATDDAWKRISA